jgi:hypothetical protein
LLGGGRGLKRPVARKGFSLYFLFGTKQKGKGKRLRVTDGPLTVLVAVAMVVSVGPALAQGYTEWIDHPYPSAGWSCEWYGEEYCGLAEPLDRRVISVPC